MALVLLKIPRLRRSWSEKYIYRSRELFVYRNEDLRNDGDSICDYSETRMETQAMITNSSLACLMSQCTLPIDLTS